MEIEGKVKVITAEQQITASYTKRELVVVTDEQYPQSILIEFGQGKCNEYLDKLKVDDKVKVSINIGGREWVNPQGETKYFNSIKGWRIEKLSEAPAEIQAPKQPDGQVEDNVSDLPF